MPPPVDPIDRSTIGRDLKGGGIVDSLVQSGTSDKLSQFSQLSVGQKIQAQVLAKFANQSFLVDVADSNVRITLPTGTKIGDKLQLSFISLLPRPTFLLENQQSEVGSTQVKVQLSIPQQIDGEASDALTKNLFSSKTFADTPTTFSAAAKLITQFLQQNRPAINLGDLIQLKPIAQSPDDIAQPEQLAQQLQSAIKSSGLFYESHIAQWLNKKLSLSNLQTEPQARLNSIGTADAGVESSDKNTDKLSALAQLVEQQLDTLDQQTINWRGEILPDVPFHWQISRQTKQSASPYIDTSPEQTWQTTVKFELPHLGEITAIIDLKNQQLQFSVEGTSEEVAQVLRNNVLQLSEALSNAGAQLAGFKVKSNE
jgi:hypothetical protein